MVHLQDPPAGWGNDDITAFIDHARQNCFATYANLRQEYAKIAEVDAIFRKVPDNLINTPDWFAALFLLRAHSAFLAGAHVAMSAQATETYALLRVCLENGLYGLYLARNPNSRETWLRRHDNEQATRRVKEEFKISNLFATLRGIDNTHAEIVRKLYERCIDYGAHPNERAFIQSLQTEEGPDKTKLQIVYLNNDPSIRRACLKTVAQVGLSVLNIFQLVFRERFLLTGLSDKLNHARQGL